MRDYPLSVFTGEGLAFFADYTNAFGIIGSISTVANAYFELVQKNNWKRIAMLYREGQYSREVFLKLREKFNNFPGFQIVFASPIYDTFLPLKAIQQSFTRVVVIESSARLTRNVLCLAYHQGMIFPNYQWVSEFLLDSDFIVRLTSIMVVDSTNVLVEISLLQ